MGPQKSAPKFGAIFAFFVRLKSSSFPHGKGQKNCFFFETGKEKDDDHDQDSLKKTCCTTKIPSRKTCSTDGHGPLIDFFSATVSKRRQQIGLKLLSRPPFTGVVWGPAARAWKCPTECFLSSFGHLPRSVPKSVFWVFFLAFSGPKKAEKRSKSTLWGTPREVPKIAQKALRGGLSGPGPGALL